MECTTKIDDDMAPNHARGFSTTLLARRLKESKSRTKATAKAKLALDSTIIMGTSTNIDELYRIINSSEYRSGHYSIFEESGK